jgi:bifunctional non-homologous end joining protein LigD
MHQGRVTIYSRSGYNWTEHFHQIAHAVRALSEHDLIIDGEATVFGNTGLPDFQALRRELAKRHSDRLVNSLSICSISMDTIYAARC